MRKVIILIFSGLLIGAGLAVIFLYGFEFGDVRARPGDFNPGQDVVQSASIGTQAPNFELQDINGDSFSLTAMQGRVVVLNFWATWCAPCKVEMPLLEEIHQDNSQVQVVAVNFDEKKQDVAAFVNELQLSFPILLDPGGLIQELYRVRGYPTTFILDESGVITFHHIGLLTEDQISSYLSQMGVY